MLQSFSSILVCPKSAPHRRIVTLQKPNYSLRADSCAENHLTPGSAGATIVRTTGWCWLFSWSLGKLSVDTWEDQERGDLVISMSYAEVYDLMQFQVKQVDLPFVPFCRHCRFDKNLSFRKIGFRPFKRDFWRKVRAVKRLSWYQPDTIGLSYASDVLNKSLKSRQSFPKETRSAWHPALRWMKTLIFSKFYNQFYKIRFSISSHHRCGRAWRTATVVLRHLKRFRNRIRVWPFAGSFDQVRFCSDFSLGNQLSTFFSI